MPERCTSGGDVLADGHINLELDGMRCFFLP